MSTLIGMNFMISSGRFPDVLLGLELATIPLAALAAYAIHQNRSAEAGIKLILSSALSSGILLYGLSMIYGTTGSFISSEVQANFYGESAAGPGLHLFLHRDGFQNLPRAFPPVDCRRL